MNAAITNVLIALSSGILIAEIINACINMDLQVGGMKKAFYILWIGGIPLFTIWWLYFH
jgi:hypothetical protein